MKKRYAIIPMILLTISYVLIDKYVGFYWKYEAEKPTAAEPPVSFPHLSDLRVVIRKIDEDFLKTGLRVATVSYKKNHRDVEFFAHLPLRDFKVGECVFIIGVETFGTEEEQPQIMYIVREL